MVVLVSLMTCRHKVWAKSLKIESSCTLYSMFKKFQRQCSWWQPSRQLINGCFSRRAPIGLFRMCNISYLPVIWKKSNQIKENNLSRQNLKHKNHIATIFLQVEKKYESANTSRYWRHWNISPLMETPNICPILEVRGHHSFNTAFHTLKLFFFVHFFEDPIVSSKMEWNDWS